MYNNYNDNETSGSDSSGRGAKGSINDRLISLMYRKRYNKYKLQKEFYTKRNIDKKIRYINYIEKFDIENISKLDEEDKNIIGNLEFEIPIIPLKIENKQVNISDTNSINQLHQINEEILNFDPKTEDFDFDNYDYYEVQEIKKGIGIKNDSEAIIDIQREKNLAKDELIIVNELTTFIDKSLITLGEIKEEVKSIKADVSKPYTMKQAEELEKRYLDLKIKVDKLRKQFDIVKYKYDFSDFAILESITIMDSIKDYKDNAKLDEIETMVNVCKNEINKIDGITIEDEKTIRVGSDIQDKKDEINVRTIEFNRNKENTNKVSRLEDKIAIELIEQQKILDNIKSRVDVIEVVQIPQINITGYGRIFASFLRIAAGILTTPVSNQRIFGIALGTNLINRGIRGLRQGLNVEQRVELSYRYEDLEREIMNCKDKIGLTNLLLIDSIEQIDKLREEFKDKFEAYIYLIPEYNESLKKIDTLKKQLADKKKEIELINKDLNLQYQKNKVKMKKIEK